MSFGSLGKPVTITITGEIGSGKAVLAALINERLEDLKASIHFDIITDNIKLKKGKEIFWKDTKRLIIEKSHGVTLENKVIHLVVVE